MNCHDCLSKANNRIIGQLFQNISVMDAYFPKGKGGTHMLTPHCPTWRSSLEKVQKAIFDYLEM